MEKNLNTRPLAPRPKKNLKQISVGSHLTDKDYKKVISDKRTTRGGSWGYGREAGDAADKQ